MERRSLLYAGGSKQIPSSVLVVHGASTVAVLSNGSCFVHLLQIEDSIRNVCILVHSRDVHVAHLHLYFLNRGLLTICTDGD